MLSGEINHGRDNRQIINTTRPTLIWLPGKPRNGQILLGSPLLSARKKPTGGVVGWVVLILHIISSVLNLSWRDLPLNYSDIIKLINCVRFHWN